MNYFFLRFLPYLYYFIREQYRIDNRSEPPPRRKRYFYRTVITILIVLLGLLLTATVVKYRQFSLDLKEAKTLLEKEKKIGAENHGISRSRYEEDLRTVTMEKFRWENEAREVHFELAQICKEHPSDCDSRTHHIIEDFERSKP